MQETEVKFTMSEIRAALREDTEAIQKHMDKLEKEHQAKSLEARQREPWVDNPELHHLQGMICELSLLISKFDRLYDDKMGYR